MNLIEKGLVLSAVLIGTYLILSNPNGTSVAANSISGGIVSVDKTLQGR